MKLTQQEAKFLAEQHVYLGMPMYGGVLHSQTFMSLLPFFLSAAQVGTKTSISTVTNNSIVSLARCIITADFLRFEEATHLLWVDADMSFDPDHIFQLLLHDKDVVGGLCPTKGFPMKYCATVLPEALGSNGNGWNTRDGLVPVAHLGTGFMLIKRQVIEKMVAAHPETKFKDSQSPQERNAFMYSLWENGIDKQGNFVGEDWMFCNRWRALGGEIWADPTLVVNHIGQFTFSPDQAQTLASVGAKPDGRGGMSLNMAPRIIVAA